MSSTVWSIDTERSSSSLSWEDACDQQTECHLQNLLDSIDNVIFFDANIPKEFSTELIEECLVWKNKFMKKMDNNSLKINNKKTQKLKSLSAPKISSKLGHEQRSLSEQTFVSKVTKLESISKMPSNTIKEIKNDLNSKSSQKPLVLPPIGYPTLSKTNQKRPNVPTICKTFPKPPPLLSIEQILCRSRNLEERVCSNIRIHPQTEKHKVQNSNILNHKKNSNLPNSKF